MRVCNTCAVELTEQNHYKIRDLICIDCVKAKNTVQYNNRRIKVLNHYSPNGIKCALCNANDIRILELDHKNRDGWEHRRSLSGSNKGFGNMFQYAIKHEYPPIFRVLCVACNNLARYYDDQEILQHYVSLPLINHR